jgi:hypothetical protein
MRVGSSARGAPDATRADLTVRCQDSIVNGRGAVFTTDVSGSDA